MKLSADTEAENTEKLREKGTRTEILAAEIEKPVRVLFFVQIRA